MIDFAWAADPDYVHTTARPAMTLNFYNQPNAEYDENWAALPEYTAKAMAFLSDLIGPYPYPQYSVIQGGDGGMEYPMATLITGQRASGACWGNRPRNGPLVVPSFAGHQRACTVHGRRHDQLRYRIVHASPLRGPGNDEPPHQGSFRATSAKHLAATKSRWSPTPTTTKPTVPTAWGNIPKAKRCWRNWPP